MELVILQDSARIKKRSTIVKCQDFFTQRMFAHCLIQEIWLQVMTMLDPPKWAAHAQLHNVIALVSPTPYSQLTPACNQTGTAATLQRQSLVSTPCKVDLICSHLSNISEEPNITMSHLTVITCQELCNRSLVRRSWQ